MKRGSITVFAALSFWLIASFLFALLEAGRVYVLDACADMTSVLAVESTAAEYQPALWRNYKLLCLDGAYGGKTFSKEYVEAVLGSRIHKNLSQDGDGSRMIGMSLQGATVERYQLLTDGDGSVFLSCVADYMRENLPMEVVQLLHDKYREQDLTEQSGLGEDSVGKARNAIEEAKKEQMKEKNGESDSVTEDLPQSPPPGQQEVKENPLELVLELKQNALLGMVTKGIGELSAAQVPEAESVEKRHRETGTMQLMPEKDWYDRVLVLEYLDRYFLDYLESAPDHVMSYELEYVLCGKESDRDNLEGVVKRLLLIRETANVAHILGDGQKMQEALAMAGALAGFTGNPAVIRIVQIGIVAAWAYVESLLDIRALLAGDKVALIKTAEQWSSGLGGLLEALGDGARAKNYENGVSYRDYLKGFLFTVPERKLAYRMMDVMEWNIRRVPAYQNCRMDYMICRMECKMEYQTAPLFWKLSVLGNDGLERLSFYKIKKFSYYN